MKSADCFTMMTSFDEACQRRDMAFVAGLLLNSNKCAMLNNIAGVLLKPVVAVVALIMKRRQPALILK